MLSPPIACRPLGRAPQKPLSYGLAFLCGLMLSACSAEVGEYEGVVKAYGDVALTELPELSLEIAEEFNLDVQVYDLPVNLMLHQYGSADVANEIASLWDSSWLRAKEFGFNTERGMRNVVESERFGALLAAGAGHEVHSGYEVQRLYLEGLDSYEDSAYVLLMKHESRVMVVARPGTF